MVKKPCGCRDLRAIALASAQLVALPEDEWPELRAGIMRPSAPAEPKEGEGEWGTQ